MLRFVPFLAALAAAAQYTHPIKCTDLTLQITASTTIIQLPTNLNITDAAGLDLSDLNNLGKQVVGGTYGISARFCEPTKDVPSRRNTLQLLVHGVVSGQPLAVLSTVG